MHQHDILLTTELCTLLPAFGFCQQRNVAALAHTDQGILDNASAHWAC